MIEKLKPLLIECGLTVHENMTGPSMERINETGAQENVPAILLKVKMHGEEFADMHDGAEDKERFELQFIRDQILIDVNERGYRNIAFYKVKYEILNEKEHQIGVRFGRW
jgi:hypothetical protein